VHPEHVGSAPCWAGARDRTSPTTISTAERRLAALAGTLLLIAGACGDSTNRPAESPSSTSPPVRADSTTTSFAPTGSFSVAPGSSAVAGTGRSHTYAVEVEDGIGIAPSTFAADVDAILAAPKGWTADGTVSLQRVDAGASFRVVLATPATSDRLCAPLATNGIYSCHNRGRAVINLTRWTDGSRASRLPLDQYRIYVISHEVGHALGHDHVGCPGTDRPAPVMMQQTKGIGACAPNPWPFP
jgi:hypothetical protein